MADLIIPHPLAEQLREIAQREQRHVEDLLRDMIYQYESLSEEEVTITPTSVADAIAATGGLFDDPMLKIAGALKEAMDAYYSNQNDDS